MSEIIRIPPNDVEAELATLGSMMIDNAALHKARTVTGQHEFYRNAHQWIYRAICDVADRNEPVDNITIQEELQRKDLLIECGGQEYLMSLLSQVPSASRGEHYAGIVHDKYMLRELSRVSAEIEEIAHSGEFSDVAIAQAAEKMVALRGKDITGFTKLSDAVSRAMDKIETRMEKKGKFEGPRTGFQKIDWKTQGLSPGVTIIAAGTGLGKTSLLLRLIRQSKKPCALFELEMRDEQLAERMLVGESGFDSLYIRAGNLTEDEWKTLVNAANELYGLDCYICDQTLDVAAAMAMSQLAIQSYGVKAIYLDYIGLLEPRPGQKSESRNLELGGMARGLKKLSIAMNVPVIFACQLTRSHLKREDKRPNLSDLRDSGELEQHADRVIFIHDPATVEVRKKQPKRKVEILLEKNRYGPTGTAEVWWEGSTMTFSEIDEEHEEESDEYRKPYADD